MGLRVLKQAPPVPKERICIYGRAGTGKSRLALSVPADWGKIVYYAADLNSEQLPSISPDKRGRVIPVIPEGDNPMVNFQQFTMMDWKAIDPEIGTIVVDTYTKVALDTISYAANSQSMDREKHYVIGDPHNGGQAIPNRGDYQAIDALSRGYLDMIFTRQRDFHIIFVMHEDVKLIEGVQAVGGPAHPGRAMTEYLPGQFSTVIRVIRETVLVPGNDAPEEVVVAITEGDGKFISKIRTSDEVAANPLAKVFLDRNPSSYWTDKYVPYVNAQRNNQPKENNNG